jgi:3-oxoacyl-[acyl-carrier protein] reductase
MNLSLENKNAVICGSTQGIGFAIAQELAMAGANCTLFARNEKTLQEALLHLDTSLHQQHHYHVADFSNPEEVKAAIQKHVQEAPVHILINNSGGPAAGPITEATEEQFLNTFNQHLICNHIMASAVIAGMKESGYGRIINIISTSVKIPLKNLGVSNTIRGAVASWAKTMANELAEFGITVNNILPGATKTSRLDNIINNVASKKQVTTAEAETEMLKEIPAKRFGEPEELAALAAFLASPSAGYINGVSIPVDGGRTGSL